MLATFDVQQMQAQIAEIEKLEGAADFYSDMRAAKQKLQKKAEIVKNLAAIEQINSKLGYFKELVSSFSDEELEGIEGTAQEFATLQKQVDGLYIATLFGGKYDNENCLLEIHSGAGGEEAQDWAEMLCRMYTRFAQGKGWQVTMVDSLAGDGAGYKSVSLLMEGNKAYGHLFAEKGVHRLVRISPFDANKRRHTSFASVDVSPIIEDTAEIKLEPQDLKIDTYRSGGAGGQHVNKTESAVRITHLPTGIVVQCQNERSQLQNKEFALKMLASKLLEKQEVERAAAAAAAHGEAKKIEWGSQIRSYVLHPYNMVKDHRTGVETSNSQAVLDGDLDEFIEAQLIARSKGEI